MSKCPICGRDFDECDYFKDLEDEGIMANIRICDRCKQPISTWDERLQDQIDREYYQDICPSCDSEIKLAEALARAASISGKKPVDVAREWLNRYDP